MSYHRIGSSLRTDHSFRQRIDEDHHKENSPLESLNINMVDDFPVADSLHLLHLGVMKKCLVGWIHGGHNFKTKLCSRQMIQMSKQLTQTKMPMEIHRSVRGLDCLKFWKGTEFKTFLMYIGPVILKDFLPTAAYIHFLLLFCAVTICENTIYTCHLNLAHQLLTDYIEGSVDLYGIDSISPNIHNLEHLVADVKKFGPLSTFSTYKFENCLFYIKCLLRTGYRPLAQVAKRLSEYFFSLKKDLEIRSDEHFPSLSHLKTRSIKHLDGTISKKVVDVLHIEDGFTLKNDETNNYFLTKNNKICKMLNARDSKNNISIIARSFKNQKDFFEKPFKSSYLNIYTVDGELNSDEEIFQVEDVKCKLVNVKNKKENVFIPLIHTFRN